MDKPPKEPIERLKRRVQRHSPHRLLRKKLVLPGGITISAEKRRGRVGVNAIKGAHEAQEGHRRGLSPAASAAITTVERTPVLDIGTRLYESASGKAVGGADHNQPLTDEQRRDRATTAIRDGVLIVAPIAKGAGGRLAAGGRIAASETTAAAAAEATAVRSSTTATAASMETSTGLNSGIPIIKTVKGTTSATTGVEVGRISPPPQGTPTGMSTATQSSPATPSGGSSTGVTQASRTPIPLSKAQRARDVAKGIDYSAPTSRVTTTIPDGPYIWVQLKDGTFRFARRGFDVPEAVDPFPHSLLAAGDDVLSAGEGFGHNGQTLYTNPRSGHYKPTVKSMHESVMDMRSQGLVSGNAVIDNSVSGPRKKFPTNGAKSE